MGASAVPSGKTSSGRFVYLVTSHRNPQQVVRLVTALRRSSSDGQIVVHHDASRSVLDAGALSGMKDVHQLPFSMPVNWGDFSIVEMNLRCLDWITRNLDFDWLVLLSGQDYPIRPLPEFEQFIGEQRADAFLGTLPDWESFIAGIEPMAVPAQRRVVEDRISRHPDRRFIRYTAAFRYLYRYYLVPDLGVQRRLPWRVRHRVRRWGAVLRPALQSLVFVHPTDREGRSRIGFRRLFTPFSASFRCYKASAWFTLSRGAVLAVRAFVAQHPEFVSYYRRTIIPDESFIQTIILNDPALTTFDDNLVYFTWRDPSSGSPDVLTSADFAPMVASGKYLARKFDVTVDASILDRLDEVLFPPTKMP
jgi:hypothetical protein